MLLNSEVLEAEQWLSKRSRDMVLSYGLAAAQSSHSDDVRLDEDIELTATLFFLTSGKQPNPAKAHGRVIAEISIPILSRLRSSAGNSWFEHRSRTDVDGRPLAP